MKNRGFSKYIITPIIFAVIETACIVCMPFVSINGSAGQKTGFYGVAAAFWLSAAAEILSVILSSAARKRLKAKGRGGRAPGKSLPGLISFFKSPEAAAADAFMLLSAIGVILIICLNENRKWVVIPAVSVLFLTFNLHCILNGRNYRYFKNLCSLKRSGKNE